MNDKCPVCNSDVLEPKQFPISVPGNYDRTKPLSTHGYSYSCLRCGNYLLESFAKAQLIGRLDNKQKIAVLSHWIRTKHEAISASEIRRKEEIFLTDELVADIIKQPPPKPAEQADNIVRWLGRKAPGENINFQLQDKMSIIGSATPEEFGIALDYLIRKGLVQGKIARLSRGPEGDDVALSFEGWQYYEKLKRGDTDSRKAFMAMEYENPELDKIVEETFKLAVKQTGFDLFALKEKPRAGLIDDRLRVEIQTSRFLIADLTHDNAGAYWEAGFAEGLGKPVIYTCEKKKFEEAKTHFDTNHHLTIPWDAENPKEAAEKLKATIRATLPEQAKLTDD